jgi:hypothetical protein
LDITDSIAWISDLKVLGNTELWNPWWPENLAHQILLFNTSLLNSV